MRSALHAVVVGFDERVGSFTNFGEVKCRKPKLRERAFPRVEVKFLFLHSLNSDWVSMPHPLGSGGENAEVAQR